MIDHATSDVYKAARTKLKVECSRARGAMSTTIRRFLSSMDDTQQRMAKKFDVCFTEKKAYCSPNTLRCWNSNLTMELTWAQAYRTPDSAKAFTSYIAKSFNSDTQSDED